MDTSSPSPRLKFRYRFSLMFGDMFFEMTRSFNKKQFKLKDHISRLMQGLKSRIPFDHSAAEIEKACNKTIEMVDIFEKAETQSHD